jgi:hypothetical protein
MDRQGWGGDEQMVWGLAREIGRVRCGLGRVPAEPVLDICPMSA